MPWNSSSPVGNISVKANRTTMNQNTSYIETTLGNQAVGTNPTPGTAKDHFWNISANLDGHHRFMQSPGFTNSSGTAVNPNLATGMDGVFYFKLVNSDVGRVEGFYRNSNGTYQVFPSYRTGNMVVTAAFTNLGPAIPINVYGDIFMFRSAVGGNATVQSGIFHTTATNIGVVALTYTNMGNTDQINLQFDFTGLQLRVKTSAATAGDTWEYRITYRAI